MVHKTLPARSLAVNTLIDMYDELDALTRENEELRRKVELYTSPVILEPRESSPLEDQYETEFAKVGRLRVYERAVCSYLSVSRYGDGAYETFEDFRSRYAEKVPDYMSRNDFYELYDEQLRADYDEKLAERKRREGEE